MRWKRLDMYLYLYLSIICNYACAVSLAREGRRRNIPRWILAHTFIAKFTNNGF